MCLLVCACVWHACGTHCSIVTLLGGTRYLLQLNQKILAACDDNYSDDELAMLPFHELLLARQGARRLQQLCVFVAACVC